MRRGPRLKPRRQRAASHISAIESGPPETASTIAGARFQSANRRFASCAEIGELSSSGMAFGNPVSSSDQLRHFALALNPLLLTVDGCFDAARGARIFPRHFAECRAGGLLLLQRRQRLSEPQQLVGRLARSIEFGGDAEEGFRGVAILLALEEALAEPILRVRDQGIAGIFLREVAHGFFGQRIILALHVADAEIELVLRGCRGRQGGEGRPCSGAARRRQGAAGDARTGASKVEWLACPASAGSADRRFGNRQLTAAQRARHTRSIRSLAGIEGIATAAALGLRHSGWLLHDRRRRGNLRVITRLWLWLPIGRTRLRRRRGGDIGLDRDRLTAGADLRAAPKLPQAIFELPVAILQLLVLAGELAQLIFELLNTDFRVGIVGLSPRR